jgi:hypothetical protein
MFPVLKIILIKLKLITCNYKIFRVYRQGFDGSEATETLESPSCITSLCHHPILPSLLAAGTFSG